MAKFDLEALKAKLAEMTPGEYRAHLSRVERVINSRYQVIAQCMLETGPLNAAGIAAVVNAAPALITRVEQLEAALGDALVVCNRAAKVGRGCSCDYDYRCGNCQAVVDVHAALDAFNMKVREACVQVGQPALDAKPLTVSDALRDERVRPPDGCRHGTHEIVVDLGLGLQTVYRVWRDSLDELCIDRNDQARAAIDWETCTLDIDELDAPCTLVPYNEAVP